MDLLTREVRGFPTWVERTAMKTHGAPQKTV